MSIQKIASKIAKREGKKHQASIGDVREILKILCELEAETPGCVAVEILIGAQKIVKRYWGKSK